MFRADDWLEEHLGDWKGVYMPRKYKDIGIFVKDVSYGLFDGEVVVGDDFVTAYEGEVQVFNFDGKWPDEVLVEVFKALGAKAIAHDA